MRKFSPLVQRSAAFVLVLLFATFFFLYRLGENHLIEFDEALYAVIAKNMLQNGNYLIPILRGGFPWFDKPPLYFWFSALSLKIFGLNAFAARLPAALAGIGTTTIVFFLGKNLFNARTGFLAAIILASSPGFLYYGRLGMTDMLLVFFFTLTLLSFWQARTHPSFYLLTGFSLGLGLLTKNLIVLLALAPMSVILIKDFRENRQKISVHYLLLGLTVAAVVSLPWHLYMLATFRQNFIDTYFLYHTFGRLGQTLEGERAPLFWYLKVIRTQLQIWYLFLYPALLWSFVQLLKKRAAALTYLLTAAATIFLVFTSASSKLIWFALPIYPFLALLIAAFLTDLLNPLSPNRPAAFLIPLLLLTLLHNAANLKKFVPPDFSRDLVTGVAAAEKRDAQKPLFVPSDNYYVTSFYNQGGPVLSLEDTDWEKFLKNYEAAFYLLPIKEVEKNPVLFKGATRLDQFGNYLLLEKSGALRP